MDWTQQILNLYGAMIFLMVAVIPVSVIGFTVLLMIKIFKRVISNLSA